MTKKLNVETMITYSDNKVQDAQNVAQVFKNSGLTRPIEDLDRIQRMINHADILLTAWVDNKMIGVARAITDYSFCCYLADLAVDESYQKQGIGKELIRQLRAIIGDECSIVLIAAPEAVEYYPHLGFIKADKAFLMTRNK